MEVTVYEAGANGHTNSTDNEVVGIKEAAELLGVHPNTIRNRIREGRYPDRKMLTVNGEAYVLPRSLIEAELNPPLHPPTKAVDHPTIVAQMQDMITQVANEVAEPLKLEMGQQAHTIERLAEDLGRERQLRLDRERDIETLKAQLAQAQEPKKRWWQR